MKDIDLYAQILGLQAPWKVVAVNLDRALEVSDAAAFTCPQCGLPASRYDKRKRRWRHLDTCQFVTILEAEIPRVHWPDHGSWRQARIGASETVIADPDMCGRDFVSKAS